MGLSCEIDSLDSESCQNDRALAQFRRFPDPITKPEEAETQLCLCVAEVLDSLARRQATIIRMRFGLDDGDGRTLKAVGNLLGLTRERIRQIERSVLSKLSESPYREKLLKFVEG